MSYQPKEGSGTLFKNDRKTTENHPDFTGSIMINGKEHWFSAWTKEGKKGKFLSVSVGKEKEESKPTKLYESVKSDPFIDDSCPF